MAKPSRAFRGMVMFLQLMVALVFLSCGGIAFIIVAGCLTEASDIVTGVQRVTAWRAVWVFGRAAAGAALTACGSVALWSFYLVLEQIREGTFFSAFHSRILGRMARCGAIMAAVLAVTVSFYTALEMKGMTRAPRFFGVSALLMCVYMPLTFLTAALAIQGVRLLTWTLPQEKGDREIRISPARRNLVNNPRFIFALLQVCWLVWLVPVGLHAVDRMDRWLRWGVREGHGLGAALELVDMALWAVMLAVLFLMCGRLRQGHAAATKRNAQALMFLATGCGAHAALGGTVVVDVLLLEWQGACIGMMLVLAVLRKLMIDCDTRKIY